MSYSSLYLRLWAKRPSVGCWHIFALSILTALFLSACGGGTSTTSAADPTDPNNITPDPITPPVVNPNTSTTVSPGVYAALWNGKEITSIVMRTSNAANDTAQLYALQFNSPDPDIYVGTAKGIGTNNATGCVSCSGLRRQGIGRATKGIGNRVDGPCDQNHQPGDLEELAGRGRLTVERIRQFRPEHEEDVEEWNR